MLEDLLRGIVADPQGKDRYLVLADWLDENDDPRRGELLRLHRKLLATCCVPDEYPERAGWQARIVALLAEGVRPCVPQRTVRLDEGVGMTFSFIPPGAFLMGSPESEEGRQDDEVLHRVTLTRGFWLGVHPITQAQWRAVTGDSPSSFTGDDLPVDGLSWNDCQAGLTRAGDRLRLPTEAEWESACRAGTTTAFFHGETLSTDLVNYDDTFARTPPRWTTTAGGTFPPNAWGLYDMHGNVNEVCQGRVHRGGFFYASPYLCRSACRHRYVCEPGTRMMTWGCRVVLCPDDQRP